MEANLVLIVGLEDGKQSSREDNEVPDELQSDGQPPEGQGRRGMGEGP